MSIVLQPVFNLTPSGAGGGGCNPNFVDPFNGSATNFGLARKWNVSSRLDANESNWYKLDGLGNAVWYHFTGGTGQGRCIATPFGGNFADVSQFAETIMVNYAASAGQVSRCGPCCLVGGSIPQADDSCYWMDILGEAGQQRISVDRVVNSVSTNLFTSAVNTWVALPVTFRLECTINVGNVTVKSYVNGVLLDTTVDTNAARLTTGYPGMYGTFCSTLISNSFSTYTCGR